jgi:hypothetical protein
MKLYQGGVKESATAISWSNQNSFTRAVTQKNSNRITYKIRNFFLARRKAVSSREKKRKETREKLC